MLTIIVQLVIYLPSNTLGVGIKWIISNVVRNAARNVARTAKNGVKICIRVYLVLFLLSSRLFLLFAFQNNILRNVPVRVHHAALKKVKNVVKTPLFAVCVYFLMWLQSQLCTFCVYVQYSQHLRFCYGHLVTFFSGTPKQNSCIAIRFDYCYYN